MPLIRLPRAHLSLCTLLAASACSAPPPSAVPPPSIVVAPQQPETPPPGPPQLGIATKLGPSIAAGRLALLQGRRVLLEGDGSEQREHVPAPWLLKDLFAVPSSRGPRIVGADGQGGLVVFDDPLGAGRVIPAPPCVDERRGVLPGTIVAKCDRRQTNEANDVVFLVPVDQGGATARLPIDPSEPPEVLAHGLRTSLPLEDAASASASAAAVIFDVLGLMVTADGGATWRSPQPEGAPGDVYQATRLRVDAAGLHAVNEKAHTEAIVDAARGTHGRFGPPAPDAEDEALWARLEDLARVEAPPAPTPHDPVSADWEEKTTRGAFQQHQNCNAGSRRVRTPPPRAPEARQESCATGAFDEVADGRPIQSFGRIAHDSAAATTKLDWYDITEVGGAVHAWKGTLPEPLRSMSAVHLSDVSPQGDHALFRFCADGQPWLARTGSASTCGARARPRGRSPGCRTG